jgi:hypothetical protein
MGAEQVRSWVTGLVGDPVVPAGDSLDIHVPAAGDSPEVPVEGGSYRKEQPQEQRPWWAGLLHQ